MAQLPTGGKAALGSVDSASATVGAAEGLGQTWLTWRGSIIARSGALQSISAPADRPAAASAAAMVWAAPLIPGCALHTPVSLGEATFRCGMLSTRPFPRGVRC